MTGIKQADLGEVIRFNEESAERIKAMARKQFGFLRSR